MRFVPSVKVIGVPSGIRRVAVDKVCLGRARQGYPKVLMQKRPVVEAGAFGNPIYLIHISI